MIRRNFRTLVSALLICALVLLSAGCIKQESDESYSGKDLTLYYVNKAYLLDESTKEVFVQYNAKRPSLPKELEKATDDEKVSYAAVGALLLLKEVPANISDKAVSVVNKDVVINNVTVKYGVAVVDIERESLEKLGGSMDESLFVSQIVATLLDSFEEVTSVQFMVDGKEVDSLMGHVDTSAPFVAPTIR
jgi:putative lipoprotein